MESYRGTRSLQSFSPAWADPEILEKTLVGRKALVDRLEELAIDGAGGPSKHQRLIVGVRGSGKTHVLRALRNRLWRNEELKKRLLIIYLLEDELGVASFLDFVVRSLRAIVRWYPEQEQLARDLDALYDLPLDVQEHRAVELLLAGVGDKDALILMENLGITFDKSKGFGRQGQQALRDLIQKHPRFMIFASSQALVEGTRDPDEPFYGFFKVIHLRRLTVGEALQFLETMASATSEEDVVRFLNTPKGRARMRAIYKFTGGNHRLLVTFHDFLTSDSLARLSELFIQALDPLKPYYQEQMRGLSAQQQKVVQYLAMEREPRTVKDIARGCLAAPNTISSQLKDLLEKNFVSRVEQQGRESPYEVTEALFRICYEADLEQEGAPVRLFVDFLANLYTAQELQLRWRGLDLLAAKLGNQGAVPFADEAQFYASALAHRYPELAAKAESPPEFTVEPKHELQGLFQQMEQAGAYREILDLSRHLGEEKDAFVLHAEASAYAHLGDAEKAQTTALQALEWDAQDVEAHLVLADVLSRKAETLDTGLEHARRARELAPDEPQPMARVAECLVEAEELADALAYLETLTQKHPDYADGWTLKGRALRGLERMEEAQAAYQRALNLDPDNVDALRWLGALVGNAGGHEGALGLFQQLNEAAPESADGWRLTARAFANLGRSDKAEPLYRKTLELDPKNATALEQLGILVGNTGQHEEAMQLFQQLNEVAPEYAKGWWLTARALEGLEHRDEAEPLYRKALELDPRHANALERLGILVGNTGQHEEAMQLFQRLNEVAPEYAKGWWLTARALEGLEHRDEAEPLYRKALALDPKNANALEGLGILVGNAGQYEEAVQLFQRLNEAAPEAADGWRLTAGALANLGRRDEAESLYRKALALDPKNATALAGLGVLVFIAGQPEEALELFQRLNEAAPEDADGWRLTAMALVNLGRRDEAEPLYRKALALDPKNANALAGLGVLVFIAGQPEEALELFQQLNEVAPENADGWWLTARALESLGREDEAEEACRKTLEFDIENGRGWALLARILQSLGHEQEASQAFDRAIALGADRGNLLNSRGEARRKHGQYELAISDYEEALQVDLEAALPYFNIVSALLALGRVQEALKRLTEALAADKHSQTPKGGLVVQSFQENCQELFEHAPAQAFATYLEHALEILEKEGYLEQFEQSLPLTVFAILKDHEEISEERFAHIIRAFEEIIGKRMPVSVAVRFLQVGIDHFKKQDRKALLRLTREERDTFCEQLGIENR